jgi:class 3 adenylate cyclase/TolB-like protein
VDPASTHAVTRRLAAIVIADVVGYTWLMERDDTGTFARLRTIRDEVVDPAIVSHGGRIVKTAGDGLLAEFPSALSAVRASVQIQREMALRNRGIAAGERIDYRIGVNLGDVMADAGDIAGDGVNVASRLEALAETAGICVSGAVRDQVHGQLDAEFVDIGEQQVKNIERPIRVFRLVLAGSTVPPPGKRAPAGPGLPTRRWLGIAAGLAALVGVGLAAWVMSERIGKPAPASGAPPMSIAVMPFGAPGGSGRDEQFADALSREVANGLGRAREVRVVSHGAASGWKGRPVDARTVGRELDVRYVAEGSIERTGERALVTVQLVDAMNATQVWNARFELQAGASGENESALSRSITASLRAALYDAEGRRAAGTPRVGGNATDMVNRAQAMFTDITLQGARTYGKSLDDALRLDPNNVMALNARFSALFFELELDTQADRDGIVRRMGELTTRAVGIDYNDAVAWSHRALALAFEGRMAQALAASDRARELDPARRYVITWRAWLKILQGRPEEALALLQEARQLFSGGDAMETRLACMANLHLGRYDEAIALCERSAALDTWYWDHALLAAAYANKGEQRQAAAARARIDQLLPGYTIAVSKSRRYSTEPAFLQQAEQYLYAGLRKAGVPEK